MRRGAGFLWLLLVALLVASLWTQRAAAHDVTPGALSLEELGPGQFLVRWTAPSSGARGPLSIDPELPEHCSVAGRRLNCGERGLTGELRFAGLEGSVHRVVTRIVWLGGKEELWVATGEDAVLELRGGPATGMAEVRATLLGFGALGVEHIVFGFDHLLFVLGLLLLVRDGRRLVLTVTAFTLAHSVTLGASVLGWAALPRTGVEVVIALSIVLLALECAEPRESLARRVPWLVAFGFGLLHGFGFAGALGEIGLPPQQTGLALLGFNLGVELGQLAVVVPTWAALKASAEWRHARTAETVLVYGMGGLGVYFALDRLALLFS